MFMEIETHALHFSWSIHAIHHRWSRFLELSHALRIDARRFAVQRMERDVTVPTDSTGVPAPLPRSMPVIQLIIRKLVALHSFQPYFSPVGRNCPRAIQSAFRVFRVADNALQHD